MRPSWDSYFLQLCDLVATRATCDRRRVGAVLVRDKRILATGYNGSMTGSEHCDDVGHEMSDGHCIRTVHAEVNAVAQCARQGIATLGAMLYCNTRPCWDCIKVAASAGVVELVYSGEYGPGEPSMRLRMAQAGLTVRRYVDG